MAEKMTKMQACGALCELQKELEKRRKSSAEDLDAVRKASVKDPAEQVWRERLRSDEIEKLDRWLRAIEMAGVALTR